MKRALIVDDNEQNLYYLHALLSTQGFVVESARHGVEALAKARQLPPDLVISDLLMPEMDGYTLLRHWKIDSRLHKIPFVVYTATYSEAEDQRLALNFGADAFILKPAEPEDFLRRIREVQASVARVPPALPSQPTLLKQYSEVLIRKLEEKTQRLEDSNRELQRELAERRQAFKATMKTVHDIASSLLNGVQLVRLKAEGQLPDEMLASIDQMLEEASLKLDALEHLEIVTTNETAADPGDGS